MKLIVFGVQQMNPGIGAMEAADLFLQRDELIPFLGGAGNGDAADGSSMPNSGSTEVVMMAL